MAQCSIRIRVRVSWWVVPYIRCVAIFAILFGTRPDFEKISATCMRGIKVRA